MGATLLVVAQVPIERRELALAMMLAQKRVSAWLFPVQAESCRQA